MKHITTLLIVLFLAPSFTNAQTYNFTNTTGTYADITGGTSFLSDFNDSIMLGYNFTISGVTSQRLNVLVKGDMTTGPYSITSLWFYPFGVETSGGQYSYVISGSTGNRITKIQFKNIKFDHEPTSASTLNYQVWLYEADNSIEIRFGTSHIYDAVDCYNTAPGPFIGMDGKFWLKGSTTAPTTATSSNYLTGTPANGTVYRFKPVGTAVNQVAVTPISVYPNPATTELHIQLPNNTLSLPASIQLINDLGQAVATQISGATQISVPTGQLPPGNYILFVQAAGKQYIKQITVAK